MAGRQIKQSKGNESYDAGHRHVFAEKIQPLPEDLKKKISVILEAIPSRSKNEIAEVLQLFDYDVAKALNHFVADGEMEVQNEWKVQGKRKKKKKKSGKKIPKDNIENQEDSETLQTNSNKVPSSAVEEVKDQSEKKTTEITNTHKPSNSTRPANGKLPEERINSVEKDTTGNPEKPLENGELESSRINVPKLNSPMPPSPTPLSPIPLSPTPLSPSESLKSLPDSHSLGKDKPSQTNSRVRIHSTSGPEVIRKSLKDLQRSSVSIARFQSMLDEEAELSTKALAKSFQALRQALDEREKLLQEQLEAVTLETRNLLQERQEDAAGLKFKCNRVGTMTEHETTELRNEIKHFVGERRIDEDLGKTIRFIRDDEKMLEAIRSFGEVTPIKHHYTTYKRKPSDPTIMTTATKPAPSKPAPTKTPPSAQLPPSDEHAKSKHQPPNTETKESNSRSNKNPVLSPSRLKDQAEIHKRLQQAVKQQVGSNAKDVKKEECPADTEKQNKPKDYGWKTSKFQGGKPQAREPHRQQAAQQHSRQTNSRNFTQNSPKSPNKHEESSTHREGENKKPTLDKKPVNSISSASAHDSTREEMPAAARPENKEQTASNHVDHHPGNKRMKRRYIRKTPLEKTNGGSNNFRSRNSPDKNTKADALKETGNKQESSNEDGKAKGIQQGENAVVNGVNKVTPLPQRPTRVRKVYYKKDPESEVKFPPARENGSLSNGTSRQSSVA